MEAKTLLKLASGLRDISACAWRVGLPLDDGLQGRIDALFEDCRVAAKNANDCLTIAIAGKFSSGKSQFINSLIGRDIAPVDSNRTTCCRTVFTGNERIHELRIVESATKEVLSLDEYKSRAARRAAHENAYTVYLPDAVWKDVNLVDTPGFDPPEGGDASCAGTTDSEISRQAVKEADVVFFLFDINQGAIMGDSMDYLKEISKENHYIYMIANKADLKPPASRTAILDSIARECREKGIKYEGVFPYCALTEHSKEIVDVKKDSARKSKLALAGETRRKVIDGIKKLLERKVGILEARRRGNAGVVLQGLKDTACRAQEFFLKAIQRKIIDLCNNDSFDKEELIDNIVAALSAKALEYTQQRSGRFIRWHALKSKGLFVDDWAIYLDRPGEAYTLESSDRIKLAGCIKKVLEEQTVVFAGLEDELGCLFKECSDMVIDKFRIKAETTDSYGTIAEKDEFFCNEAKHSLFCECCDYKSERSECERKIHVRLCSGFPESFREFCRPRVSEIICDSWDKHVEKLVDEFKCKVEPLEKLLTTFCRKLDAAERETTTCKKLPGNVTDIGARKIAPKPGVAGKPVRNDHLDNARSSLLGSLGALGNFLKSSYN